MLDISDKIAAFIKKLTLWKNDIENVSGSSQYFAFMSSLLEKNYVAPFKFTKHIFPTSIKSQVEIQKELSGKFFQL